MSVGLSSAGQPTSAKVREENSLAVIATGNTNLLMPFFNTHRQLQTPQGEPNFDEYGL
jgi:hypothetical protein